MKHIILVGSLILCLSGAAFAHAKKQGTTPEDGAQLTETPEMIHMVFDDPMRITFARLIDAEGAEMPLGRKTGMDATLEFHAEPDPLPPGRYTFEWRGLSADGHALQDSLSFDLAE